MTTLPPLQQHPETRPSRPELCRCCSSQQMELVLDLGMQPWGNHFLPMADNVTVPRYPLELLFCHGCSMVQIGHTVPKEQMFVDHHYLSGTTRSLDRHFGEVAESILKGLSFQEQDYALDIGGNDGTFLSHLQRMGLNVLNVDSGRVQTRISEERGVPALNRFFNLETALDVLKDRGPARLIHGSGVLFHLEELHSAFDGIEALLSRQGVLVAEFIYLPEMIAHNAFDQIYHEHLLYYSLLSFSRLLEQHGLAAFDAVLKPIHGGSCVSLVGRQGEVPPPSDELERLLAMEMEMGVQTIAFYQRFAERAREVSSNLARLVRDLRSQGKTLQALGAPVKGTTILNFAGLDEKDIDCAVEINHLKCGTYYPGTRIPVLAQETVPVPDVYLLLAWNFKDEILDKLSDFRAGGGRVLVPIPEPHLI